MTRVVLVPGVLALLPEYAGQLDPVAELRAACLAAVGWLGPDVTVLADAQGERVAAYLLGEAAGGFETGASAPSSTTGVGFETGARAPSSTTGGGFETGASAPSSTTGGGFETGASAPSSTTGGSYLVVGNGSATRTEKAPGHLDERAHAFDAALGESLRAGRPEVDPDLARELWASVEGIERLRAEGVLEGLGAATVDYDDDPFGVQYWVMRWGS